MYKIPRMKISKEVMDKAFSMCDKMKANEWLGILYGKPTDRMIDVVEISDIFIPEQFVNGSNCEMEKGQNIETMVFSKDKGKALIGWIHSHNDMTPFLSSTDHTNIKDMLDNAGSSFLASIVVTNDRKKTSYVSVRPFKGSKDIITIETELEVDEEGYKYNHKNTQKWVKRESKKIDEKKVSYYHGWKNKVTDWKDGWRKGKYVTTYSKPEVKTKKTTLKKIEPLESVDSLRTQIWNRAYNLKRNQLEDVLGYVNIFSDINERIKRIDEGIQRQELGQAFRNAVEIGDTKPDFGNHQIEPFRESFDDLDILELDGEECETCGSTQFMEDYDATIGWYICFHCNAHHFSKKNGITFENDDYNISFEISCPSCGGYNVEILGEDFGTLRCLMDGCWHTWKKGEEKESLESVDYTSVT